MSKSKHPDICLYQPEIPQNTGNIGRLAAGAGCKLHLIEPLGFSLDDRYVRRAGLDYWPYIDLSTHQNFAAFVSACPGPFAFLSTKSSRPYSEIPLDTTALIFGRETAGLPPELHERYADQIYTIPMYRGEVRSFNLANAVSIVVYDQIRQRTGFTS